MTSMLLVYVFLLSTLVNIGYQRSQAYCKQSCLNGGICLWFDRCKCKSGYTGDHCNVDERYCRNQFYRNQFYYLRSMNKIPSYYPRKSIYNKGDTVTFSCPQNYKLKSGFLSETKAYCWRSGWSITWPLCTVIRCEEPASFPGHAEFVKPGAVGLFTDFTVGTEISFKCKSGLYVWGNHIATCSNNGFWDNIPQCITLEAYKRNCAINDEEVAYKGYLREPYCRSKVNKLPLKKQFKTITVVTSIAAGTFGILLLMVAVVAFQRRRLLIRIRHLQESESASSSEMTSNLDEDIYVHHILPSYAEAVRNKPNEQPPSFAEATQTTAGSNSSQVDQTQQSVPSTILEATAIDQNNPSPPPYELGATACDVTDGTGAGSENAVFVEDVESLTL